MLIQKDANQASSYLNKLSSMMRFMLYETKTEKIPLAKELAYVDQYMELQKIRTANPGYINYQVEGDPQNIMIKPMLFIPFIENAFKHTGNKKTENAITIHIAITQNTLRFSCKNNYTQSIKINQEPGGLGNELIERRLALLYPRKHVYEITNANSIYHVNLLLSL